MQVLKMTRVEAATEYPEVSDTVFKVDAAMVPVMKTGDTIQVATDLKIEITD